MVLSKEEETKSKDAFQKISSSSLRTILLNSTVKLTGPTPTGFTFSGSGAILGRNETDTWLLSAKHNLYICDDKTEPPEWSADLATYFQEHIKIYYDGPMAFGKVPAREASISEVIPVTITVGKEWEYDVMILKSTDADLRQFAVLNSLGFPSASDIGYLTDASKYLDKAKQVFFQIGYGNVTEVVTQGRRRTTLPTAEEKGTASSGQLQYRAASPLAKAIVTTYNANEAGDGYNASSNSIQLSADPDTSTAPGDSGGPLFVAAYQEKAEQWKGFLIGVTTGADMSTAEEACPPAGKLRVNNISTSLEYCYRRRIIPLEGA